MPEVNVWPTGYIQMASGIFECHAALPIPTSFSHQLRQLHRQWGNPEMGIAERKNR